jgi:hypothetical protein
MSSTMPSYVPFQLVGQLRDACFTFALGDRNRLTVGEQPHETVAQRGALRIHGDARHDDVVSDPPSSLADAQPIKQTTASRYWLKRLCLSK